ncbi:MAG: hypothetical protein LBL87_05160 [Ruminococcus sp.]|jgi:hypothetical protein|nr:hypothetical protein [Ruminococcus sp.]
MDKKKKECKKGDANMPTAIKEAIRCQYKSIDVVNDYLINEIENLKRIGELDDNDPEKIQKKQELHDLMVSIGIITEDNELTDNYK